MLAVLFVSRNGKEKAKRSEAPSGGEEKSADHLGDNVPQFAP
jgi:hypothetical protein